VDKHHFDVELVRQASRAVIFVAPDRIYRRGNEQQLGLPGPGKPLSRPNARPVPARPGVRLTDYGQRTERLTNGRSDEVIERSSR